MRGQGLLLAGFLILSAGAAQAAMDFSDYDDEMMRTLDQTVKYFEPDISGKNSRGATEDAQILLEGFKYAEDYFAKKEADGDGAKIAQQGKEYVATALKSVEQKDFDNAAAAAREAARTCRSCHDAYKVTKK